VIPIATLGQLAEGGGDGSFLMGQSGREGQAHECDRKAYAVRNAELLGQYAIHSEMSLGVRTRQFLDFPVVEREPGLWNRSVWWARLIGSSVALFGMASERVVAGPERSC